MCESLHFRKSPLSDTVDCDLFREIRDAPWQPRIERNREVPRALIDAEFEVLEILVQSTEHEPRCDGCAAESQHAANESFTVG